MRLPRGRCTVADLNFLLRPMPQNGTDRTAALEREIIRQKRELYAVLCAMERRISALEIALSAVRDADQASDESAFV